MNRIKLSFINFLILVSLNTFAQNCDKLLQDGLYSFTKMTKTESFGKDLRNYYLSETFKSDMRSGRWGASLTIPIKNVPFSIGANDSEDKFTELRTKLLSITELKLEANNVQVLLESIPNINLYDAYIKCIDINRNKDITGFVQGTNVETDDAVVFTIYYRPSSPIDPMPKVTAFNVIPEGSVISGGLKVGENLSGFTTLITCKRPVDKDLILTIQTDRGAISSKASAQENIASSKELPIGTIITSYLNFEQFNIATKNNEKSPGGIWTSAKSKWAPCDGRPVPNSKFLTLTSQVQIPDLRGMFLRGLNTFDPYQPVPAINPIKADTDNRVVGSYQQDGFAQHKHDSGARVRGDWTHAGNDYGTAKSGQGNVWEHHKSHAYKTPYTSSVGGKETRPKNIAVFYYIKIN